ncbi:MAG TPA: hypothetical protein VGZ72_16030, partial [Stellaceae bacterium]|nr:hypothetical protein [Stellaceae bacterium]
MIRIEPYRLADLPLVVTFVAAIQEHESATVPELKPSPEIAAAYTEMIMRNVREKDGVMLMARHATETVGFADGWAEVDQDPCLEEEARRHAYVSDIYFLEATRR